MVFTNAQIQKQSSKKSLVSPLIKKAYNSLEYVNIETKSNISRVQT